MTIRIANASGYFGDRNSAWSELLEGGPVDVITGDYLAELTMLILARQRLADENAGYARSFLAHMEQSLATAIERGVKVVVNAGGLNPAGLAAAVRELAANTGIDAAVAHVEGDDLMGRADELGLGQPIAANAYLGAFGIAAALDRGADVVITGRVTDASLVVGPAAAHFGWGRDDLDMLAGAVIAGHVIECGTQATGGNYAFFTEIGSLEHPGFPIAEIESDGSSVITKHDGTDGEVSVGTVTAQLLYEIGGHRYANPDVTARFETATLDQIGPDRVRISGTVGEPPPPTLKVGVNTLGGFRNEVTFVLTGLDIEAKADLVRRQMTRALGDGLEWTLARTDHPDADTEEAASAMLHCVARSSDADKVGRNFSGAAIELALASYPGFTVTAPPAKASPYGVFTAAYVPQGEVPHEVVLADGERISIDAPTKTRELADTDAGNTGATDGPAHDTAAASDGAAGDGTGGAQSGPTRSAPLGTIMGARSGDKGGSANLGVWARTDAGFEWLRDTLTVERLGELLPEVAPLPVTRHVFANMRALNFVIEDILGEGVSSNHRFDPQAKGLGEWLRSRHFEIPEELL